MKALTALVLIMGMSVASGAAVAGDHRERHVEKGNNDQLSRRPPEVRGYLFRPGGHRYDYEYDSFLERNGPYGNYPQLDTRNFWERVMSDPRSTTTSPSAF
jgi:hypothetical protein